MTADTDGRTLSCKRARLEGSLRGGGNNRTMVLAVGYSLLVVSAAQAEFVEYYRSTTELDGAACAEVIASYDIKAMELRAELISPIGMQTTTTDLVDQGAGVLTGSVSVSVGGDPHNPLAEFMVVESQFMRSAAGDVSHEETIETRLELPCPECNGDGVTMTTNVRSSTDANGDTQSSAALEVEVQAGKATVKVKEMVTQTNEGTSNTFGGSVEVASQDGPTKVGVDWVKMSNPDGTRTETYGGSATIGNDTSTVTVGVEREEGPKGDRETVTAEVTHSVGDALEFNIDGKFERRPDGSRTAEIGVSALYTLPVLGGQLEAGLDYSRCLFNSSESIEGVAQLSFSFLDGPASIMATGDTTYCCPDPTTCVPQSGLKQTETFDSNVPVRVEMVHQMAFDSADCDSFTEELALTTSAVPIGDLNCDGVVTVGDINPFVVALTDSNAYADQFPECSALIGDCTGDGQLTVGDINCFVALITGG